MTAVPTIFRLPQNDSSVAKYVNLDHTYPLPDEKELKRRLDTVVSTLEQTKKKLKEAQQSKRRLLSKCDSLQEVVSAVKSRHLISENVNDILKDVSSKVPFELFQRIKASRYTNAKYKKEYTTELKCFALTLHFYSSKAYNFVRQTFCLCLPHEKVIQKWYSSVRSEAGFTTEAFSTLETKVKEEKEAGNEVHVALMFDEVSIKQKIEWDGKKYVGVEDVGNEIIFFLGRAQPCTTFHLRVAKFVFSTYTTKKI